MGKLTKSSQGKNKLELEKNVIFKNAYYILTEIYPFSLYSTYLNCD